MELLQSYSCFTKSVILAFGLSRASRLGLKPDMGVGFFIPGGMIRLAVVRILHKVIFWCLSCRPAHSRILLDKADLQRSLKFPRHFPQVQQQSFVEFPLLTPLFRGLPSKASERSITPPDLTPSLKHSSIAGPKFRSSA